MTAKFAAIDLENEYVRGRIGGLIEGVTINRFSFKKKVAYAIGEYEYKSLEDNQIHKATVFTTECSKWQYKKICEGLSKMSNICEIISL